MDRLHGGNLGIFCLGDLTIHPTVLATMKGCRHGLSL
jgi:hypothetical protein